ncbi:MAG: lytic transglycosylase domain-containing protein, partial [Caulobacteraceae bacterium]
MAVRFDLRRAFLSAASAFAMAGLVAAGVAIAGELAPTQIPTVQYALRGPLSDSDTQALTQALEGARLKDPARIRQAMATLSDPLARKIALWALIQTDPDGMSYAELDQAGRDLAGWPGARKRIAATEKVLGSSGLAPRQVVAWFAGAEPLTGEGAMALAGAYQAQGETAKARDAIRRAWLTKPLDSGVQQQILARFGGLLTQADDDAREDMLLYGDQGQAAVDLLPFLSPDARALAQARMAVRSGSPDASSLVAALPVAAQSAPGLKFEEALRYERSGDDADALAVIPSLAAPLPDREDQERMWRLRKGLVVAALKSGDSRAAYRAAADSGVDEGGDGAEAEFYAGWLALDRLHDPKLADQHFARLQAIGDSPITASRALYWRGKAAEAMGDAVDAQLFYAGAARYQTAFYGQLAAAKIGQARLDLGKDPTITAADRARFEAREPIRAAKLVQAIGADETFHRFVMGIADDLT